jgi:Rrf2 family transcriptional regulator, nitric oxide-sensitive transcriptional repressor
MFLLGELEAVRSITETGKSMLSQTVEYALRAITQIALRVPQSCTTEDIAEATMVPKAYLSKVLQSLRRAGLVNSQRGVGGGTSLARTTGEITVLDVVNAVEPIQRIRSCPLGLASHGTQLCALHQRIDNAIEMVEQAFAKTTLAEILASPNPSTPLCERMTNIVSLNLNPCNSNAQES